MASALWREVERRDRGRTPWGSTSALAFDLEGAGGGAGCGAGAGCGVGGGC